ncbi:MAG: AAA family ATPase [Candidatus Woesearchaeota archaeon]
MIIAVSGTPGVGKTYIAKKLSKASGSKLKYFDLNKHIRDNRLYDSYDKKAKTYDVDVRRLDDSIFKIHRSKYGFMDRFVNKTADISNIEKMLKAISKYKPTGIIIDSHLSHYMYSDYCIIVRSDIKRLNNRLRKRKYSETKIKDNIESEIFEVCLDEARNLRRNIIILQN